MANRLFSVHAGKPSTSDIHTGTSTDRRDDRPIAVDSPAKRARVEEACGPANAENINPDRGADLNRRHEGFMTAMVEKSLHKCSTEGQIFSPAPPLARRDRARRAHRRPRSQPALAAALPSCAGEGPRSTALRVRVPPAAHRNRARRARRAGHKCWSGPGSTECWTRSGSTQSRGIVVNKASHREDS